MGTSYYQDSQMIFSPIGSATGTPQIDPQAQVEGKVLDVQPISTVATTQIPPVYTNSTPMAMYAQGTSCQDTQLVGIQLLDLVYLRNS